MSDAIELAVFGSAMHSIAEEMGLVLRKTAFSPNIKERRDYSTAVFDGAGNVIAIGENMPVHLGSMPKSVEAALAGLTLETGDVAVLNDPYAGGTHLPDITLVMPVFVPGVEAAAFYVANRAHHADVGGMFAGSMGPCREIWQEGIRIPPVRLQRAGQLERDMLALLLANVRTPREREGDLTAQLGACRIGGARLQELVAKLGLARVQQNMAALLDYSERMARAELARLPAGIFQAEDFLDDDGVSARRIRIAVSVATDPATGSLRVDFSGSDPQVAGSVNAVYAIAYSAVFYLIRCLLPEDVAPTAGLMRPVYVSAPAGSVVAAASPAAVAGGNVETSQRIVDTLLRAFARIVPERIPAASSGSMSNLTIGGTDSRTGALFAYYETIAGGSGARPEGDGIAGIHTHMTNSLNTPVEALEYAYPLRVRRYAVRHSSGGAGRYRGGDGLVREVELLDPARVTILSDRRLTAPYGLAGGADGQPGRNSVTVEGVIEELPGKCSRELPRGAVLRIETPGGGGWGAPGS